MAWQAIARALSNRSTVSSLAVLVHAPGEQVERSLEGKGMDLRSPGGVLQSTDPENATALELALRSDNRRLVSILTEEGVPAVGFVGGDRGILGPGDPSQWLEGVIRTGTVPVVASATVGGGAAWELPLAESVAWLTGLSDAVPVLLVGSNRGESDAREVSDRQTAEELETRGISVVFSTLSGLLLPGFDS